MSGILDMAHDMARDLHDAGVMDTITMRMMDELCLPPAQPLTAGEIRAIRRKARMSQAVFAAVLNVASNTVAQWEQGKRSPSGPSIRLLDLIRRKGVEALL